MAELRKLNGDLIEKDDNKTLAELVIKNKANLRRVDLRKANLQEADLRDANLQRASLREANLREACLQGAYLRGIDLRDADLRDAYLQYANLQGADLRGADLPGVDLQKAKLPDFKIFPEEGSFICWKKFAGEVVGKILVPTKAQRMSSLVGRKGRVSEAHIIETFPPSTKVKSWNGKVTYTVPGDMIPDSYNDDIRIECSHGIHVFLTRKEAEQW